MNIIIKKYLLLSHYYKLYKKIYKIFDYDDIILYNNFVYNLISPSLYYIINFDRLLFDINNVKCINLALDLMDIKLNISEHFEFILFVDFNTLNYKYYNIDITYFITSYDNIIKRGTRLYDEYGKRERYKQFKYRQDDIILIDIINDIEREIITLKNFKYIK